MRLGKRTRAGHALPGHRAQHARSLAAGMASQEVKPGKQQPGQGYRCEQEAPESHENHLSPKCIPAQTCRLSRPYSMKLMTMWSLSQPANARLMVSCVLTAYSKSAIDSASRSARTGADGAVAVRGIISPATRRLQNPVTDRKIAISSGCAATSPAV